MQEIAIAWTAWAWVTVWWLDTLFAIVVGPLALLPILSFIVVTIAMLMISFALFRNRWLWPG
jgi:hypothetical protein